MAIPSSNTPLSTGIIRPVLGWLADGQRLGPEDYRAETVRLLVAISTTTTSGNATYRVPTTHNFLIKRVRGSLSILDVSGESQAISNMGNPGVTDRYLAKAANCKVDLKVDDTGYKLFDSNPLILADILGSVGGYPIDWRDAPFIVQAGQTLRMDIAMQDTASDIIGNNSEYGLVLEGFIVRVKES